jgi:3-oxoacyl-[acyl-carrier-protein] synthase II
MRRYGVIVTGIGIICALGEQKETFWNELSQGKCGLGEVDLFEVSGYRSRMGGQVRNVDLLSRLSPRECRRMGRCDQLGLWAAQEALKEAKIMERNVSPERVAVVMGAGAGGVFEAEKYRRQLYEGRPRPRPSLLMPFPACNLTDAIGNLYGFSGVRSTIATACSSSATAIGYGADLIRSGKADVVVAGGAESLSELTFSGFNALRSVDRKTCRPFDRNREGLVLGESGSILVLESEEFAALHGVSGYAEVMGYGISADAYHMTSPDLQGEGAERSMSNALASAGIPPEEVDYINAHGTGTVINDKVETQAIKRLFGESSHSLPISSVKSALGHCLGAAGAVEAIAAILALYHGVVPPTLNYEEPDPDCDLDYVPNEARKVSIGVALSNSFAFGGNNTTLVFGRTDL